MEGDKESIGRSREIEEQNRYLRNKVAGWTSFIKARLKHTECVTEDTAVTEHHKKEKSDQFTLLEKSSERLRLAVTAAKLGIWDWKFDEKCIHLCEDAKRTLGVKENRFYIGDILERCSPEDITDLEQLVQQCSNNENHHRFEFECAIRNVDDNQQRHIKFYGAIYFDAYQTPYRAVGTVADITDTKGEEEKGAQLAAIVKTSYDAIISKSLHGDVMTWNTAAEHMFGYTAEEMIGNSIIKIIPEDRLDEENYILNKLRKGETVEHFETRRLTSSGNLLDVSLTVSPIRNKRGDIIGISKIVRDITDKKQEERRKNDFISIVSHELKTPLTSILLYAQVTAKNFRNSRTVALKTVEKIEVQTKKLIAMIGDFLSLTQLEEGKIHLRMDTFELSTLINEIVEDAALLDVRHTIKVIGDPFVKVKADRDKIGQVLSNLVSNATKYSPAGGEVIVGFERNNGKLKLFVQDQGIGISKAEQRKLFQRFYRANDEASKNISGFGIGLFLVSKILQEHGSTIHVESEKERGSTFFFFMDEFQGDNI
ncbi:PAS domain S-box protein [Sphingobacterium sp. SGR-19]|uniref:PAS domain-containing sensor histidine kinase n=1 Tax=Sphingobacterium sp. SGR-19 TaxID=2710886 RepID=UPI0013EE24E4|nr:PAS domain S-box protein [Sphingobacterium sp. SGR-19]NGM66928.1 PAS domain S-box protein [Sphingobacterium sp. SGR-19]